MRKETKSIGIITFLLFSLFSHFVLAQKNEKVIAIAHYDYSHFMDTTKQKGEGVYKEEMRLILSKNASVFSSSDLLSAIDDFNKRPSRNETNGKILMKPIRYYDPTELYIFHNERKMFVFEKLGKTYLYESPFLDVEWTILNNTKVINGMDCQEAQTFFEGRMWNVWFCPEIPFQAGPWHLNGLPGLIIYASDSKGHISYSLNSFELMKTVSQGPDSETEINLENRANQTLAIRTSAKHVKNLWEGYAKNPKAFILNLLRSPGDVKDVLLLESLASRPICNNPISLRSTR